MLDVSAALSAIAVGYRLIMRQCLFPTGGVLHAARLLAFSSKDAQLRRQNGPLYGSRHDGQLLEVQSRMGMLQALRLNSPETDMIIL